MGCRSWGDEVSNSGPYLTVVRVYYLLLAYLKPGYKEISICIRASSKGHCCPLLQPSNGYVVLYKAIYLA
jgi:hypothetical protein